jgi:putative spermidine/putrescine transport system substrate-binding protein
MEEAGTIDEASFGALPEAQGDPVNLTPEQEEAAKTVLGAGWAQAIS